LADKLSEEYKGNTKERDGVLERLAALFSPRRSKRFVVVQSDKREILKILMKRTRVETESDENRLSTDEVALLVLLFAGPSFLFFFKKVI
tara:strand:+ start:98 stop:367 length:270 start_codon:yes stop_codon:yes gene_type:complete